MKDEIEVLSEARFPDQVVPVTADHEGPFTYNGKTYTISVVRDESDPAHKQWFRLIYDLDWREYEKDSKNVYDYRFANMWKLDIPSHYDTLIVGCDEYGTGRPDLEHSTVFDAATAWAVDNGWLLPEKDNGTPNIYVRMKGGYVADGDETVDAVAFHRYGHPPIALGQYFRYNGTGGTRQKPLLHAYYEGNPYWHETFWHKFEDVGMGDAVANYMVHFGCLYDGYSYDKTGYQICFDPDEITPKRTWYEGFSSYATVTGGGVSASIHPQGNEVQFQIGFNLNDVLQFDTPDVFGTYRASQVNNVYSGLIPPNGVFNDGKINWGYTFGIGTANLGTAGDYLKKRSFFFSKNRFIIYIPFKYTSNEAESEGYLIIKLENKQFTVEFSGWCNVTGYCKLPEDMSDVHELILISSNDAEVGKISSSTGKILDVFNGEPISVKIKMENSVDGATAEVTKDDISININPFCGDVGDDSNPGVGYVKKSGSQFPFTVIPTVVDDITEDCYRGALTFNKIQLEGGGIRTVTYTIPETVLYYLYRNSNYEEDGVTKNWIDEHPTASAKKMIEWMRNGGVDNWCVTGTFISHNMDDDEHPEETYYASAFFMRDFGDYPMEKGTHTQWTPDPLGSEDVIFINGVNCASGVEVFQGKVGYADNVDYNSIQTSCKLYSISSGEYVKWTDANGVEVEIEERPSNFDSAEVAGDIRVFPTIVPSNARISREASYDAFVVKGEPYIFSEFDGATADHYNPKLCMSYRYANEHYNSHEENYIEINLAEDEYEPVYGVGDIFAVQSLGMGFTSDMAPRYRIPSAEVAGSLRNIKLYNPLNYDFDKDDTLEHSVPSFLPLTYDLSLNEPEGWDKDRYPDEAYYTDTSLVIVARPVWKGNVDTNKTVVAPVEETVSYKMYATEDDGETWEQIDFILFVPLSTGGYEYMPSNKHAGKTISVNGESVVYAFPMPVFEGGEYKNKYYHVKLVCELPYREVFGDSYDGSDGWSFPYELNAYDVSKIDSLSFELVDTKANIATDCGSHVVKYLKAVVSAGSESVNEWARYGDIELCIEYRNGPSNARFEYAVIDENNNVNTCQTEIGGQTAETDLTNSRFLIDISAFNDEATLSNSRHVFDGAGTCFIKYMRILGSPNRVVLGRVYLTDAFEISNGRIYPSIDDDNVYVTYAEDTNNSATDDNKWVLTTDNQGHINNDLVIANVVLGLPPNAEGEHTPIAEKLGIAIATGGNNNYTVISTDTWSVGTGDDVENFVRIFEHDSPYGSLAPLNSITLLENGKSYRMIGTYNNREYICDFECTIISIDDKAAIDFRNIHAAPDIAFKVGADGTFDVNEFFKNGNVDYNEWKLSTIDGQSNLVAELYVAGGRTSIFLFERVDDPTWTYKLSDQFSIKYTSGSAEVVYDNFTIQNGNVVVPWSPRGSINTDTRYRVYVVRDVFDDRGRSELDIEGQSLRNPLWKANNANNGVHTFSKFSGINESYVCDLQYFKVVPPTDDDVRDMCVAIYKLDGDTLPPPQSDRYDRRVFVDYKTLQLEGDVSKNPASTYSGPFEFAGGVTYLHFTSNKTENIIPQTGTKHADKAYDYTVAHNEGMWGDNHNTYTEANRSTIRLVEQKSGTPLVKYHIYTHDGTSGFKLMGVCYKISCHPIFNFVACNEIIGSVQKDNIFTYQGFVECYIPPALSLSVNRAVLYTDDEAKVTNCTIPLNSYDHYIVQVIGSTLDDVKYPPDEQHGRVYENSKLVGNGTNDKVIRDIWFETTRYKSAFTVTMYGFVDGYDEPLRETRLVNAFTVINRDYAFGYDVREVSWLMPTLPLDKARLHIPPNEWLTADNFNRVIDRLNYDMDFLMRCASFYNGDTPILANNVVAHWYEDDAADPPGHYGNPIIGTNTRTITYKNWDAMSGLSVIRMNHSEDYDSVYLLRGTSIIKVKNDGESYAEESGIIESRLDITDFDARIGSEEGFQIDGFDITASDDVVVLIGKLGLLICFRYIDGGYRVISTLGGIGGHDTHYKFYHPSDVRVDNTGKIWVLDYGNKCFKCFDGMNSYRFTLDIPADLQELGDPIRFVTYHGTVSGEASGETREIDTVYILYKENIAVIKDGELYNVWSIKNRNGATEPVRELQISDTGDFLFVLYNNCLMRYDTEDGTFVEDMYLTGVNNTQDIATSGIVACCDRKDGLRVVLEQTFTDGTSCVVKNLAALPFGDTVINDNYQNEAWKINDMYVDRDESIQDSIVNISFQRFTDNLRLFLHSLNGKVLTAQEKVGDEYRVYMHRADLTVHEIEKIDTDIKNTVFVGINEIVTADVINRCVDRIYDYMNFIMKIMAGFYKL